MLPGNIISTNNATSPMAQISESQGQMNTNTEAAIHMMILITDNTTLTNFLLIINSPSLKALINKLI